MSRNKYTLVPAGVLMLSSTEPAMTAETKMSADEVLRVLEQSDVALATAGLRRDNILRAEHNQARAAVAALIARNAELEAEASARRSGWNSFEDDEDPSLLVVAHDERPIHFTGPDAWHEANAYEAARAEGRSHG